MNKDTKQVIVVRKDLNMRKGKMCAQVAHASMKALLDEMNFIKGPGAFVRTLILGSSDPMSLWLNGLFTKIVVSCDSELELFTLRDECLYHNVRHALIKDSGKTEFKVPTYTCLAVGPDFVDNVDDITEGLKLL